MSGSPIDTFLDALGGLDADAATAMFAPDARLLTVDGRRAHGTEAIRALLTSCLATLRSANHRVTAQWHLDDAWIAEFEAAYELTDRLRVDALPRAIVIRTGPQGATDVRVYGAHEHQLADHDSGGEGMMVGGWRIPPL